MTQLKGKNILITGAGGGFGEQFVRQLLAKEANLVLTDVNEAEISAKAETWAEEVGRGRVLASLGGDLSSNAGVDDLYGRISSFDGPIDVLINNAGIGLSGRHDEVPQDQWERLMQINLLSPMRLAALVIPQMIERRQGHIVNICSMASWVNDVGLSAYSASKFGLRGFSEALAEELAPHNVQVSAVHPFYSKTPILSSPRYGSLAERLPDVDPDNIADLDIPGVTDPADVIREAIEGIEANRLHIFPDRTGRIIYRLSRFRPRIFNVIKRRISAAR